MRRRAFQTQNTAARASDSVEFNESTHRNAYSDIGKRNESILACHLLKAVDCFTYADPTIVPAKTFLSQLV